MLEQLKRRMVLVVEWLICSVGAAGLKCLES